MDSLGLIDLGSSGLHYTWSNCRFGKANIIEKLDRGVSNIEWYRTCSGLTMFYKSLIIRISP